MDLYVEAYRDPSGEICVDLETLVVLFIYKLIEKERVNLHVKFLIEQPSEPLIKIYLGDDDFIDANSLPQITNLASTPIIVSEKQVTAGLCSVARGLLKTSSLPNLKKLLGFKEACLLACSGNSIWTRFCEVDIIETTKNILRNKYFNDKEFTLPSDMARFEYHLSTPIRIHNVYKEARVRNKNKDIKSGVPISELNLEHTFSEGPIMTLSDVILYQCYEVLLKNCPGDAIKSRLPLTINWFDRMEDSFVASSKFGVPEKPIQITRVIEENFQKQSLYKTDPIRYKPEKRIFTKQADIEGAINLTKDIKWHIINENRPFGADAPFSWSTVPLEANPNGGALPKKRAHRKSQQLENMAKAVLQITNTRNYRIVDFCSGSGHLGILLATLLPDCEIVLVENKEKSLARAKERIEKLSLTNVVIVQSNLDYFRGGFDLGVALHACGVATDLVVQRCIRAGAHLVVCPCCYGGLRDSYDLVYPLSEQYRNTQLDYKGYLNVAHAADQTHDEENAKTQQGFHCMDVIDTDRRLYIESFGYKVHLGKLSPVTCTNKNNLIVGLVER